MQHTEIASVIISTATQNEWKTLESNGMSLNKLPIIQNMILISTCFIVCRIHEPSLETVMGIIVKLNCQKIWPNVDNSHISIYHRIGSIVVSTKHNYIKPFMPIVVGDVCVLSLSIVRPFWLQWNIRFFLHLYRIWRFIIIRRREFIR